MAHEYHTFQIKSPADGLMIDCLEYKTPSEPKAVVQMAHGMCEYKDRYIPLMEYLSAHGYICIMNDHRGHGKSIRSMDDLGHFYEPGGQGLITDMLAVTDYIQKTYPDLPLLMFGHSMGSFAVRTYIKEHDDLIKGLIVCGSPSDTPARGMGKVILNILKLFKGAHGKSNLADNLFSKSFNKNFKEEGPCAWICTDPEVVKAYLADPFCGYSFTINGYQSLMYLMSETYSKKGWKVSNPDLPIRFISGENDPCATDRAHFLKAVDFIRSVGYRNVEEKMYPGMRHEIHNEKGKEQVWQDILAYLDSFLS
ncbi:MAG: alpha/beta hydrolase [Clostridia bacterium]|nr:alpha/beta hydrolase [Clostridia bacterium]